MMSSPPGSTDSPPTPDDVPQDPTHDRHTRFQKGTSEYRSTVTTMLANSALPNTPSQPAAAATTTTTTATSSVTGPPYREKKEPFRGFCRDAIRCILCRPRTMPEESSGRRSPTRRSRFREHMDVSLPVDSPQHEINARRPVPVPAPRATPESPGGGRPESRANSEADEIPVSAVQDVSPNKAVRSSNASLGALDGASTIKPVRSGDKNKPAAAGDNAREEGIFQIEDVHGPISSKAQGGTAARDFAETQNVTRPRLLGRARGVHSVAKTLTRRMKNSRR